jgi:hypothetical protein
MRLKNGLFTFKERNRGVVPDAGKRSEKTAGISIVKIAASFFGIITVKFLKAQMKHGKHGMPNEKRITSAPAAEENLAKDTQKRFVKHVWKNNIRIITGKKE